MAWGYYLLRGVIGWLGRQRGSRWRGPFLPLDNRVEDTGAVLRSRWAPCPFDTPPTQRLFSSRNSIIQIRSPGF